MSSLNLWESKVFERNGKEYSIIAEWDKYEGCRVKVLVLVNPFTDAVVSTSPRYPTEEKCIAAAKRKYYNRNNIVL